MMKSSMNEIDSFDAADGPVVSEGGCSPSTLSTGRAGPLAPGQRWSAARKREVVLRLMRGEAAELLSRELGLPLFKLEQWRQRSCPWAWCSSVDPRLVRGGQAATACKLTRGALLRTARLSRLM